MARPLSTQPQRRLVGAPPRHAERGGHAVGHLARAASSGSSTSAARTAASTAASSAGSGAGAPPTTSTTSPAYLARGERCLGGSASVPRQTSSWSLVSSRTTATGRARARRRPARPRWRPPVPAPRGRRSCARRSSSAATRRRRAEPLRGRNPSTQKRSVASPLTTSAPRTDDGPGTVLTVSPADGQAGRQHGTGVRDPRRARVAHHRHRGAAGHCGRHTLERAPPRCARAARAGDRPGLLPPGSPMPRAAPACAGCPRSR